MSLEATKSRHILELDTKEKQKFLDSFDIVLSDCDGVVWMLIEPIPNTGPAINLIKKAKKQYKFISNNSMRTDQEYLDKFSNIGVKDVNQDDIVYPAKAIIKYINSHFPGQPCLCLGTNTFNETLKQNGVNVKTKYTPSDIQLEDLPKIIKPTDKVAAVVMDIHVNLTYTELALAQQYLLQKDSIFIVGATDSRIPVTKDLTVLGPNGFIRILVESCNKEALIFGKPSALLGQYLLNHFQIDHPKRVLFVGDNLDMDIKFGGDLGFQTLFVLTGAHSKEEMLTKSLMDRPDYYADSMADFIEFFNDLDIET